jgi:hypothetical protein
MRSVAARRIGGRSRILRMVCAVIGWLCAAQGARADIQMPVPDAVSSIAIDGESAEHWQQGALEAWVIHRCVIHQADMTARGDEAVVWVDRKTPDSGEASCLTVYLEGSAAVDYGRSGDAHPETGTAAQSVRDHTWFGRLTTYARIDMRAPARDATSGARPPVYQRAQQAWSQASNEVQFAQYTTPAQPFPSVAPPAFPPTVLPPPASGYGTLQPPVLPPPAVAPAPEVVPQPPPTPIAPAEKRVHVGPRSNAPVHIKSFPGTLPNQSVTVFSNGIRAVIEGVEAPRLGNLGRIVIETDRMVLWAPNLKTLSSEGSEAAGGTDVPIEVYLEGNIAFRQGDRLIYADRMYYNATYEYGVVLAAEVFTPVPDYQGIVRLKADVLQQLNRQFFQAYGAAITTSQMGVPNYWLQAEQIGFQDTQVPRMNALTGQIEIDPQTNEAAVDHDMLATSYNNFLYVGGVPVFYWPAMATDLRQPSYYLQRFSLKNDSVFGTQVMADWDLYQLLRIKDPPMGTDWSLSTDYLSKRGPALGTNFNYDREGCFGHPGHVTGWFDAWGIYDTGFDNLGQNRRHVVPDTEERGRAYWRHRHELPEGWEVIAKLGYITDRNFLEQYFEKEWDEWPDEVTSLELRRTWEDQTLRVLGQFSLNDNVSQTEWWPRGDHFLLGRSLWNDHLTWYAHTQAAYTRFNVLNAPTDPEDAAGWQYLPWEQPTMMPEGGRFATRQELDLPLQLGPVKAVPYALGEVAYWGQGLDEQRDITRAFGQGGVRMSLPFWKVYPTVQSLLLNLNGLAHKVTLESDLYYADASQDITEFPLYDPLEDDSQEHFLNYLGNIPWSLDPRNNAFRAGLQNWVSSPTLEMVDDVAAARLGIHQRWQTKRGMPGEQHVVDWIVLDVDGTIFPNKDRDNFGQYLGLLEYDFRWHVGDRVTVLSDGYMDMFSEGLRMFSVGSALSRPERGQVYGGITSMEGPLSSTLLVGAVSYRLSHKWIVDVTGTYDLGPTGNIGERIAITRVGESMLVRLTLNADLGRDNVGASIAVEPRFLPKGRLGRVAGVPIPPVGMMGIE